jgi:hypothetical protein
VLSGYDQLQLIFFGKAYSGGGGWLASGYEKIILLQWTPSNKSHCATAHVQSFLVLEKFGLLSDFVPSIDYGLSWIFIIEKHCVINSLVDSWKIERHGIIHLL